MAELEIYLSDLTAEAQWRVVKFLTIKAPAEANLDILPVFTLPKPN